ncbi:MAG TPA: hypothetical protein VMT87_01215 [Vicinamibacteria bacterium]|nr:hypothetical protein [Vicinamibacteria bacterium]
MRFLRLLFVVLLLVPVPALAETRYSVHALGTLGGLINEPYDLSPTGRVVGRVLDPTLAAKAVLWARGSVINLNGPVSAAGEARGISSDGLIAAGSLGNRAAVWQESGVTLLDPVPGHIASVAYDVNASGLAIGWSVNSVGDPTAAAWIGGLLTPLDVNHSWAFAVNDQGQIVGRRDVSTGREARLWQDGNAATLPDLGGNFASATNISPRGAIITGGACQPTSPTTCALYSVIWVGKARAIVRLMTFPGALDQNAWSANDRGVIVGDAAADFEGQSTIGLVWQLPDLAPVDLNTRIDPGSGWTIESARAVNQSGVIAAYGRHPALSGRRAVLLRPIDEAGER